MVVALLALAAVVVSTAVTAAVLVSVASRREDSAWTLAGPAPGPVRAVARRIVGFYSEGIEWLELAGGDQARPRVRAPGCDVVRVPSQPKAHHVG